MICSNCGIDNDDNLKNCRSCGEELTDSSGRFGGSGDDGGDMWPGAAARAASVEYAGFWKRALATMIDNIILVVPCTFLGMLLFGGAGDTREAALVYNIINIILFWLYSAFMESSSRQATIGKSVIGIIVTDINGERISFYRASGRHFGKIVSSVTLGVGFIMAGFTKKKQALHDLMFDCLVVKKNNQ